MRIHHLSLGLLTMALLAGATPPSAFAWPLQREAPRLDAQESAFSPELFSDLDPSFLFLEPGKDPFARPALIPDPAATPPSAASAPVPVQETQSAIARSIKSGYSVKVEPEQLPAEMNRGYAITDSLKAGVRAGFDSPVGEEMRMTAAGAEAKLSLGRLGPAISWGWNTGVDMSVQAGRGTHAIESGPQFKLGDERLAFTLSPKVAHNFGGHQEGEVAFAYAAGLKSELAKGISLGVEAFGSTSEIASVPGTALQTHRTTPGLYVGLGLLPQQKPDPNGSKLSLEIGALADMSEAHPDWTGKLKAAVTW